LQPTKSKKEKPKHLVETDLDDNNMDNELAKQIHRKGVTQIEVLIIAEE